MDLKENCIEWLTGQDTVTVSLTQKRFINRVLKLAKKNKDAVKIVAKNKDGSLCAHLPIRALHLFILTSKTPDASEVSDLLKDEEAEDET
jgi:hypothetical protein